MRCPRRKRSISTRFADVWKTLVRLTRYSVEPRRRLVRRRKKLDDRDHSAEFAVANREESLSLPSRKRQRVHRRGEDRCGGDGRSRFHVDDISRAHRQCQQFTQHRDECGVEIMPPLAFDKGSIPGNRLGIGTSPGRFVFLPTNASRLFFDQFHKRRNNLLGEGLTVFDLDKRIRERLDLNYTAGGGQPSSAFQALGVRLGKSYHYPSDHP